MEMRVGDLMRPHPVAVQPGDTIRHAFRQLCALRTRHLLVMEGDRLVGIVTDRDIRLALPSLPFVSDIAEMYLKLDDVKVRDVMTRHVFTVAPDTSLRAAVDLFLHRMISGLPVVAGGRVVGILTETDALRALSCLLGSPEAAPQQACPGQGS